MRMVRQRSMVVWSAVLIFQTHVLTSCGPPPQARLEAEEHYQVSQEYLSSGSYQPAEKEIRKALDLVPHEARYFELLALIYQGQGRLNLADDAYRAALQQPDPPPSAMVNYSTVLLQRDRYDEAIELARRALQNPGYDKPDIAYYNIGYAYLKKGEVRRAVDSLRTALEYQPSLPQVHYHLGLAYARLGERAQAARSFRDAIRYQPSYIEAHAELGKVLLEEGHRDEARAAFERVVALAPDSELAVAARRQLQRLNP